LIIACIFLALLHQAGETKDWQKMLDMSALYPGFLPD
jgi:hypothetical protein